MMEALVQEWLAAKEAEAEAVKRRRAAEDAIAAQVKPSVEGVTTHTLPGYVVKVTGRVNRKVDADKLQELANEAGLSDHLSSLFRWKPEINQSVWKATDKSITNALALAITAEPGRPSFSITTKDN